MGSFRRVCVPLVSASPPLSCVDGSKRSNLLSPRPFMTLLMCGKFNHFSAWEMSCAACELAVKRACFALSAADLGALAENRDGLNRFSRR